MIWFDQALNNRHSDTIFPATGLRPIGELGAMPRGGGASGMA